MKIGPNLKFGTLLFLGVFVASAIALYGGAQLVDTEKTATAAEGEGGTPGGPVAVTIVAKDLKFDKRTITASPGAPVTVTLDNQDPGVLHNIAFYTNRSATTKIAGGEIIAGPAKEDVRFTAPGVPGSFFFRCDVHPDTMTGTFTVK